MTPEELKSLEERVAELNKVFNTISCIHCEKPITRSPAPIYTPSIKEHRRTFFHLADTMEEAQTLDDDHKAEN